MPSHARAAIGRLFAATLTLLFAPAAHCAVFSLDDVGQMAQKLAAQPYQKPDNALPPELANLNYDQYRDIRFKPEKALWRARKLPFELQFFHAGSYFNVPVRINLVGVDGATHVPFNPSDFDYGNNKNLDPSKLKDIGFAGFRVHFPLNQPDYNDEVLLFLGASYFKALGKGQRYGLSARGLAVDTGLMSGEEFPYFTEYWIARPSAQDQHLVIYALLDSRRVTGAYRFDLKPGNTTEIDVQARLYQREAVGKLGIAPLTSMFFSGENQRAGVEDYRPELHDSDGLSIQTSNGEWIWRPLVNPRRLLITSFALQNPKGFGLMQRDRDFTNYQDLETHYERRPSLWVQPKGDWGSGRVELVQIPSPDETNDNVVAFWVRDVSVAVGQPIDVAYTLHWQMNEETRPPSAHTLQSRRGRGSTREPDNTTRMVVDFAGPALKDLPKDTNLFPGLSLSDNAELIERQVYPNEETGGWRLSFRFRRLDDQKPVEMRAFLRHEQDVVSETWSYVLP